MKKRSQLLAVVLLPTAIFSHSTVAMGQDLIQTYQLALESDPIIRAEEAAFDAAHYSRLQAQALYLPSLTFSASNTKTDEETISSSSGFFTPGETSYTSKTNSLTLTQAIYRWDYFTQLRQADALKRQAAAKLNAARQALIVRVAAAYFDVLAARDGLEFAEAEKNAIARQLEQTKQRFEVGLIAITDVHESQAAYDLATASEIAARNKLAVSQQALRELTGNLPDKLSPLGNRLVLSTPEPADIEQWIESSMNQNFDIIGAEAAFEAARHGLGNSRAAHHPTVDLVATNSRSENGGSFGRETQNSSVTIQLSLPLFQGGGAYAKAREGAARLTQAKEALELQRRASQRNVSEAYLNVVAGISQVKALQQAVTSSKSALTATEAGYEVGTRTTVDVLNTRRELFRAQRDYSRSRYDYILASLRLKQEAGTLDLNDLKLANSWLLNK